MNPQLFPQNAILLEDVQNVRIFPDRNHCKNSLNILRALALQLNSSQASGCALYLSYPLISHVSSLRAVGKAQQIWNTSPFGLPTWSNKKPASNASNEHEERSWESDNNNKYVYVYIKYALCCVALRTFGNHKSPASVL